MAKILNWQGTGVLNGALTTATAGTGDNPFSEVVHTVTVASAKMVAAAGTDTAYVSWDLGYNLAAYAVRAYISIDALPASGSTALIVAEASAAQTWRLSTSSGGSLQLRDGGNVVVDTGPLLAVGTEYRVEVVVSGTTASLHVYNPAGVSIYTPVDSTITAGGMDTVKFGKLVTVNYGPTRFDNMAVGNTAAELGSITPPVGTPTSFTWAGDGLANQDLTTLVGGTGDSKFFFVQGSPQVSAQAILYPAITGTWYATAQVADAASYAVRMYFTTGSYGTRSIGIAQAYDSVQPDANRVWKLTLTPTGILQLRDAGGVVRVDGPILALNKKFHIEVVVAAGVAKLYVWNEFELAIYESASVSVGTPVAAVQFGKDLPDAYGPLVYDNLKILPTAAVIGPATSTTPPPPSGKKIAIIGDSMMRQGGSGEALYRTELVQRGWGASDTFFYAADGKRLVSVDSNGYTTLDNIAQARAAIGEPDVWLIALGMDGRSDDDGTTISQVGTVLSAIGAGRKVIWVNVGIADANDADVLRRNQVILSTIFVRGGKSKTADWQSWIHDGRDETGLWNVSGIALTSDGFRERVRFIGLTVGYATVQQPTANGGQDKYVEPYSTAALVGTDSDPDGLVLVRQWRQISGPTVTLVGTGATVYYQAPAVVDGSVLRFSYRVTDDSGQMSPDWLVTHRVMQINEKAAVGGVYVAMQFLQASDIQ